MNEKSILNLAKKSYLAESLKRPDWTVDCSRNEELMWLDKNENIDPYLSEKLQQILKNLQPFSINTYPETAKIYKKIAIKNQMSPNNFILTNGSDGSIRMIFDVFIEPGDKVVYPNPTFAMYSVYSKMFGAKSITLNYDLNNGQPSFNVEKFFEIIKNERPKLVCLPNPDSPTGTVLDGESMEKLIRLTHELNILLLIDEAYYPFYEQTVLPLVNQYPNLVVCRTFSKAWGAAGVRVGFLAANSELMNIIHKNRAMYELSTLSAEFIYQLLEHEDDMKQSVLRLKEGKKYFIDEIHKMGFKTTQTHGNFIHVNFAESRNKITKALSDLVLFRSSFNDTCLEGFSRFSLGTTDQFKKIIEVIKKNI